VGEYSARCSATGFDRELPNGILAEHYFHELQQARFTDFAIVRHYPERTATLRLDVIAELPPD
jgi:hypothetical protein